MKIQELEARGLAWPFWYLYYKRDSREAETLKSDRLGLAKAIACFF